MRYKINSEQPDGFLYLARYVAGYSRGMTPERVEWGFGVNLETEKPDSAAALMRAVASQNTRCKYPAYHFIVSFDPADAKAGRTSPKVTREIAEDIIKRMGLREYQTLVYAHKDTENPHIHFLVNRIHPTTGKAFSRHEDGKRLLALCREIARERGMNIPREHEGPERGRYPSDGEFWLAKKEEREPQRRFTYDHIQQCRNLLRPMFHEARSWDDLQARLKEVDLYLVPKGQGLIITDGVSCMKLTDLKDDKIRLGILNERFHTLYENWQIEKIQQAMKLEDRDLPEPPDLEGLNKEQRQRAEALHRAKIDLARAKRAHDLDRQDAVIAFDFADQEVRYWETIRDAYFTAERRIKTEEWRKNRQEEIAVRASGNVSTEEGRLFGIMEKVYFDADAAHEKWKALEKDKGSVLAAEMVLKKPKLLGRTQISLFSAYNDRLAAQRALDNMIKRRKRWHVARARLEGVREKQQRNIHMLQKHVRDYEMLQRTAGDLQTVKQALLRKIKLRAKAISRVTPRMFESSRLSDERLRQLKVAYRDFQERKNDRDRNKQLERDLWGRER